MWNQQRFDSKTDLYGLSEAHSNLLSPVPSANVSPQHPWASDQKCRRTSDQVKGPKEKRSWRETAEDRMICEFHAVLPGPEIIVQDKNQFWRQSSHHHAWVLTALFPLVSVGCSVLLLFMDSNKFLILSLAGFFRFLTKDMLFATEGSSRVASPQGWLLDWRSLTSWCKIQALSLASSTNFCSWLWLTFLLMLREVSNGFWMCSGEDSGLFCSLPCRIFMEFLLKAKFPKYSKNSFSSNSSDSVFPEGLILFKSRTNVQLWPSIIHLSSASARDFKESSVGRIGGDLLWRKKMTIMVREKFVIQAPGILLVNECTRAQHRMLNTKALTRESRAPYR